ncbi:AraC family transcriptional regulator [Kiritimatiellota bacterium B12222]|nr:AraC family transcriptional regulator [Kiritimatiellota bacterium B12222]
MRISQIRSRLEKGVYLHVPPPENGRDFPLSLAGCGHDRWIKNTTLKCHYSDITVFEFVVSGNQVYHENGEDYLVGPGEMFILHRAIPHDYSVGPAGYVHKRFVSIRSACINAMLQSVGLHKPQVISFVEPGEIQAIFRKIGRYAKTQEEGFHLKVSMMLYRLIVEASLCCTVSKPLMVEKAMAYMAAHIKEKITLEDLVGICGGSARHFSRVFKQSTGEAPLQWLLSLRRNEAIALICQTDLPIGEIASRVGYPDPLGFSAFFKKHMGQSPSEMRAKARLKES